jgi:hypothetical protein
MVSVKPIQAYVRKQFILRINALNNWTDISTGGHFAAMEQPTLLAEEIITFAEKILNMNQ